MAKEDTLVLTARDGAPFRVRRLRRGDAPALQAFNRDLGEDRALFIPHAYDPQNLDKLLFRSEQGDDWVLGLFAGSPDPACGRLVGYFFLWYFRERVPLLGIGLLGCCRGLGLGEQMIRLLVQQSVLAGCEAVELTTLPDNQRAFSLYEKCGFDYYKDVENLDGTGRTVVERAMVYRIKPGARPMDTPHRPPV